MKKLFLSMVLAAGIILFSAEESKAQFGIQAGVVMPQGDWSDIWGTGFGGQLSYKKEAGDNMKIGGTIGYFSLPGDEIDFLGLATLEFPDITLIPVLGTFDYMISDNLYVGGDAGYNVISFDDVDGGADAAGSSLAIIPKAGVSFGGLSVEGRYNVVGDSYLSFLVGYSF